MKLNLNKPLVFFDIESTGLEVGSAHIVEICLHKVMPDGSEETMTQRLRPADANGNTLHIPEETSAIHGIYDKDVADKPSFAEAAQQIADFIGNADLAGYNSNKFDIPMLVEEFLRINYNFSMEGRHCIDVQNIFHKMEQRTLKAAYRFYCHDDIDKPHAAEDDTIATYKVLMAQLDRYQDADYDDHGTIVRHPVTNDVAQLARFSTARPTADLVGHLLIDNKGRTVFGFGKYKGKTVEEVFDKEPSYYDWMMKADFPLSTKSVLREIRDKMRLQAMTEKWKLQ